METFSYKTDKYTHYYRKEKKSVIAVKTIYNHPWDGHNERPFWTAIMAQSRFITSLQKKGEKIGNIQNQCRASHGHGVCSGFSDYGNYVAKLDLF